MLRAMRRRTPLVQIIALCWATFQLLSPAVGAVADGKLARGAAERVAHVESTTSATCPVVHPSDCALCRYLSGNSPRCVDTPAFRTARSGILGGIGEDQLVGNVSLILPEGRAPPAG
jgi:hypothetical protein